MLAPQQTDVVIIGDKLINTLWAKLLLCCGIFTPPTKIDQSISAMELQSYIFP